MRHAFLSIACAHLSAVVSVSYAVAPAPDPRVMNNFVQELLSIPNAKASDFAFANPRDGWVFVSFAAAGGVTSPVSAFLDEETEPIRWRPNPDTRALESMRFIDSGEHVIRVTTLEGVAKVLGRLDVRAVPEIAYCYYPTHPHVSVYGPYDWAFMTRYVLSNVNALITRSEVPKDEFNAWLSEGRRWIANASLPGLSSPEPPTADEVYSAWASNVSVKEPGYSGLMVDEFLDSSAGHYEAWSEALKRLDASPEFRGKTFYAWCGNIHESAQGLRFGRMLSETGHAFSYERYLPERPTVREANGKFEEELLGHFKDWKAAIPGVERRMVMCLGYLSAPPESLNTNPGVDYQVFLDMQFHYLANEPAFRGLYGIMEYMADYADEESLRYAHRLFRHYCIEGKRNRYNDDPYNLSHLANPDFADGLDGWMVEPAQQGSVIAKSMKGFSWLEGRYPKTRMGDTFCMMTRSGERPNRVSQTIRRLTPGRLYSVKVISADLGQLDKAQELALSISVKDAETLEQYRLQFAFPSCYGHDVDPYNKDRPAHFNFHRIVFRAKLQKAELTIADWIAPDKPGGSEGQETAFNFVEVQPFHEP